MVPLDTETPYLQWQKFANSLSNLLDLNKELINLKGKTTEKLGLIGKEKAIACEVICSISKWKKLMF